MWCLALAVEILVIFVNFLSIQVIFPVMLDGTSKQVTSNKTDCLFCNAEIVIFPILHLQWAPGRKSLLLWSVYTVAEKMNSSPLIPDGRKLFFW